MLPLPSSDFFSVCRALMGSTALGSDLRGVAPAPLSPSQLVYGSRLQRARWRKRVSDVSRPLATCLSAPAPKSMTSPGNDRCIEPLRHCHPSPPLTFLSSVGKRRALPLPAHPNPSGYAGCQQPGCAGEQRFSHSMHPTSSAPSRSLLRVLPARLLPKACPRQVETGATPFHPTIALIAASPPLLPTKTGGERRYRA